MVLSCIGFIINEMYHKHSAYENFLGVSKHDSWQHPAYSLPKLENSISLHPVGVSCVESYVATAFCTHYRPAIPGVIGMQCVQIAVQLHPLHTLQAPLHALRTFDTG